MKYPTLNIEEEEILNNASPINMIEQFTFKEFKLQGNDMHSYYLIIDQGKNSIFFRIKNINDLNDIIYKKESSLGDFYNVNTNFRKYKSCEQLFRDSFAHFSNENILIFNENGIIKLIFLFKEKLKDESITFILEPEQSRGEDIFLWNLYDRVSRLEHQNKINKNIINQFEKIIKNKKDKTFLLLINKNKISLFVLLLCFFTQIFFFKKYSQDKIISELKNQIFEMKQYYLVNKRNYYNLYSGIIKNDELELIEKEIIENLNKRIINFKLLYRASRDGYEAHNFHKKCDGSINTLTLVKTITQIRFGGFTENSWDIISGNKNEKKGFVFSLNDKKIFYNQYGKYNIYCDREVGPSFIGGNHDFSLVDKCNNSFGKIDKEKKIMFKKKTNALKLKIMKYMKLF